MLEKNWKIAQEVAAEDNREMDSNRLRLVGPMHIAETREQAFANVRFGFQKFIDYMNTVVPGQHTPASRDIHPCRILPVADHPVTPTACRPAAGTMTASTPHPGSHCYPVIA